MKTTDDKILLGRDELPLASLLKMLRAAQVVCGGIDELEEQK